MLKSNSIGCPYITSPEISIAGVDHKMKPGLTHDWRIDILRSPLRMMPTRVSRRNASALISCGPELSKSAPQREMHVGAAGVTELLDLDPWTLNSRAGAHADFDSSQIGRPSRPMLPRAGKDASLFQTHDVTLDPEATNTTTTQNCQLDLHPFRWTLKHGLQLDTRSSGIQKDTHLPILQLNSTSVTNSLRFAPSLIHEPIDSLGNSPLDRTL